MRTGLSGDVYVHLAAGRWMLAHHSVIRRDVFSYTVRGRPWIADEWGFEVALAWLVRTLGPVSFWIVSAGSCSVALLLAAASWRRIGATWLWTAALACVATAGLLVGLEPRPQDPSYALFAGELLLLRYARRDRRWLLSLPPLLLVWANLHGSFLLGLAVLLLEILWSCLAASHTVRQAPPALPARALVAATAGSALATFVNPHGPALLDYAVRVASSGRIATLVEEWQSPDFHTPLLLLLVAGPVAWLLVALGRSRAAFDLGDVTLAMLLLLATLQAVRFLPYFVLAWCAAASRWSPRRPEGITPSLLSLPLAACLAAGLALGGHTPPGAPLRGGAAVDMPVGPAAYLLHRRGRVFTTYWWGDYLVNLGVPVFVDGRTDLYAGTGVLAAYLAVADLTVDPDTILARYRVRWVLWNEHSALSTFLAEDPRWSVVLRSGDAVVFERLERW
ncbi:MAG: hypothetical protein ACYCTE_16495 [Acidimicrobiales bacterium]